MRNAPAILVLLPLLGTACLQISTTGFSESGGTSTGGLPLGDPCASNGACGSGICGLAGTGNCCATGCTAGNAVCGATGCDDAGACVYPAAGIDCGPAFCSGQIDLQPQCDGAGGCAPGANACPYGLECNEDGGASGVGFPCESRCISSAECAGGLICGAGDADCMRGYCNITFTGCGVSPELTDWNSLSYAASLPSGADIQLEVRVTTSLNAAVIAAAQPQAVCDSLQHPANASSCPRNPDGSINLAYFNLPQGSYLTVFVTLIPSTCDGGSSPASVPTLNDLAAGQSCPSN